MTNYTADLLKGLQMVKVWSYELELSSKQQRLLRHLNSDGIIEKVDIQKLITSNYLHNYTCKDNAYVINPKNRFEFDIYWDKDLIMTYKAGLKYKEYFSIALNKIMSLFLGGLNVI